MVANSPPIIRALDAKVESKIVTNEVLRAAFGDCFEKEAGIATSPAYMSVAIFLPR